MNNHSSGQIEKPIFQKPDHQIQSIEVLTELAESAMRNNKFSESLDHWNEVIIRFPHYESGYIGAARVYIKLEEYHKAEQLCKKGLACCPSPNLGLLVLHSDIASSQKDFSTALTRLSIVRKYFPHTDVGYRNAAFVYMELLKYDQADKICEEGIKNCKNTIRLFKLYIQILLNKNLKEKDKLLQLFFRQMNFCYNHPQLPDEMYRLANICGKLVKYDKFYCFMYNLIIQNIIDNHHHNNNEISNEISNKFPKLCFFSITVENLKYFIYVIRCFLPCTLDIVIERKEHNDKRYLLDYYINSYNIVYGKESIKNYDYVILDGFQFHLDNNYCNIHNNVISLLHTLDNSPRINTLKYSKLVIVNSKNQNGLDITLDYDLFDSKTLSKYNKINGNGICEIAYTGPYHIGEFLKNTYSNTVYKNQLFNRLQLDMDQNKPLCVLFEDEISHFGQIVYCLNKLSDFVNIIIKPYFSYNSHFLNRLDKRVYIYQDRSLAPNLLRYSADFILAGYSSGTFCSSVMLGLNVIPYYSRIVYPKGLEIKKRYNYRYFIDDIKQYTIDRMKINLLMEFNPFDLLDINRLKKAFFEKDYIDWYKKNLINIQKNVFGDYILEDAPEKTAEYIMRFVRDKTLGKDCSSIFIK